MVQLLLLCWNICVDYFVCPSRPSFSAFTLTVYSYRAILLLLNLALVAVNLFYTTDHDIFQNWGKPGTGTEGLAWYPTNFTRDILPIPCHSHNDYWRRVPLFSALRAGCIGVEADVWHFDNDLYIGHNTASLTRNRTFQTLYIDPLVELLTAQNQRTDFYSGIDHGVFDSDPEQSLTLLIDVKTGGAETWPWILKQLQPLRDRNWLSFVENDTLNMRAVTVVGTGNTPFDVLLENGGNASYRDTFFDAPLDIMGDPQHTSHAASLSSPSTFDNDLPGDSLVEDGGSAEDNTSTPGLPTDTGYDVGQGQSGTTRQSTFNSTNSYYASVSFGKAVGSVWRGRLSSQQMEIIRGQVRGAHSRGLKARYWDIPAWPLGLRNHIWDVLVKEGVDMLNVDDLRAASKQVW